MKKIKVRIRAEVTLFYDHEIKIDEEVYEDLKFDPSLEDSEYGLLLLKFCKNKIPKDFMLDDASVIQEIQPKPKIKKGKEKTVEQLDENHFKEVQARARYHSLTLEKKEGYVVLTYGYNDSKQIKTWKNKVFNKMTLDTLSSFLNEL